MSMVLTLGALCTFLIVAVLYYRAEARYHETRATNARNALKTAEESAKLTAKFAQQSHALKEAQRAETIKQTSDAAIERRDAFAFDWMSGAADSGANQADCSAADSSSSSGCDAGGSSIDS